MDRRLYCAGKVVAIACEAFTDERGTLTPIDFTAYDFRPVRAFVVAAEPGAVRGGHGHRRGRQILMHARGEIEIELSYRGRAERLVLDANLRAILIEPPVWARQIYLGESPALIVLCDTPFDPDDYFAEKDEAR